MKNSLVIIPTYNEIDNIETIIKEVLAVDSRIEVLIIDDNSPDGTGCKVDTLALNESRIHVLHRTVKNGLGQAYKAGIEWALSRSYKHILEMDADLSHDPRDIPRFLEKIHNGSDVVLGSRYVQGGGVIGWSLKRKLVSSWGSLYARTILGVQVKDLTGGYKCFHRKVLEKIDLDSIKSNGFSFQIELTYHAIKHGFRIQEIPIVFRDRRLGKSKMSTEILMEAALMVFQLRF
jgi:dolichol-phosphate mannosyltransferase